MKKVVSSILIFTVLWTTLGCSKEETSIKTIKIAYLPITHSLPMLVEKDLLEGNKNLQIELVKYGSWTELMDALMSGRVDGALVLIELALRAKEYGIDLKAVALGHRDGNVVIVGNDINSAEDLKGKTFAIPHRLSSHNLLLRELLTKNGICEEDINIVELAPTEMPAALSAGQISGYCVAEPFGAKAIELNIGKVLYESKELWDDSICCALVLNNEFITSDEDTSREFVAEYMKAGDFISENPDQAKEIAKKYLNVDEEVLDISMNYISYDNLQIDKDAYENIINRVKEAGISDNPPTYENFVENLVP